MVNRREVLVGAAAVACASIGGAVSAAVPEVADVVIYGAGPLGEFQQVNVFVSHGSDALDYFAGAQGGLRTCERSGIRPLGFVLSDRAFVNLWLDHLKRLDRYSWPKPVSYVLLGYPVVFRDGALGAFVLESPVIENDNKDLAFFFGE